MSVEQVREVIPCAASPDCLHDVCAECGIPMRAWDERAPEHPGTYLAKATAGMCLPCVRRKERDAGAPRDSRLLSDRELLRIRDIDEAAFAWHIARRKRIKAPLPEGVND